MAVPISNVTRRQVYAPSGAGGAGPYAFTFEILANTDIAVYKDDTLLTLTTHYTVTINANGTGSVTITAAGLSLEPTSPTQYAIVGNRTISRSSDFTTGGDFFANTLNDELDQQTIFAQQNAEAIQRALVAPQTDPTSINMTLPRAVSRAGRYLAFDTFGNPTVASDVAVLYQGAKASDPATRNDGDALEAGDLYFNTVDVGLRAYTGTAWVVAVNATDPLVEQRFVATAGQTTATFTGGYRVGFLYVFVNGVMLDTTDITATNGTTVTFASALSLNDEVRMITFKAAGSISTTDIGALAAANNLSDVASVSTARNNLGLGALAVKSNVATADIQDAAVSTAKLADGSVTAAKLAGVVGLTTKLLRARYLYTGTSYTPGSDVAAFYAQVYGATGGVSGSSLGGIGGPGYSEKYYSSPSGSYSYSIGAGGNALGSSGGSTTFGVMSVTGSAGVTTTTGSAGGAGSGGDFNASGGNGGNFFSGQYGGCGGAGSRAGNGGNGSYAATGQGGTGGNNSSGGAFGAAATSPSGSAIAMPWGTGVESFLSQNTFGEQGAAPQGCPILSNSYAGLIGFACDLFPLTSGIGGIATPIVNPATAPQLGPVIYPFAKYANALLAGRQGLIVIIEVLK
jgi:hypothetical protein